MPKMNGVEYIDYLIEQAPGISVIVITGFPDPIMANTLIEKKGVKEYLVKPIEKEKLFAAVE